MSSKTFGQSPGNQTDRYDKELGFGGMPFFFNMTGGANSRKDSDPFAGFSNLFKGGNFHNENTARIHFAEGKNFKFTSRAS